MLDYNWRRYQRVVDIGGAYGSFLARILRHNAKAAGVLFDQPQVRDPSSSATRRSLWVCHLGMLLARLPGL